MGHFSSVFSTPQSLKRKTRPCLFAVHLGLSSFLLFWISGLWTVQAKTPLVVNVPISSHSTSPSTNIPHDFLEDFFLPESLPSPNYYCYSSYLIYSYQLSVIFQVTWTLSVLTSFTPMILISNPRQSVSSSYTGLRIEYNSFPNQQSTDAFTF